MKIWKLWKHEVSRLRIFKSFYSEMRLQKNLGPIVQDKTRAQAWGINFEQLGFVPMYLFLEVQLTPFESVQWGQITLPHMFFPTLL